MPKGKGKGWWRARVVTVLVAAGSLVVTGTGVPFTGKAAAETAPPAGVPATVSADALPTWQINGVVWGQVVVGNTVYATGSFTKARPPGVAAGGAGEVSAFNIFAYDIVTGNRVTTFNHSLNAQGRVITASPDGSRIYVGGDFTTVDGVSRGHVVSFTTVNGSMVSSFVVKSSHTVKALTATASTLYIGGPAYATINGVARKGLSAVSTTTGALLPWAPTADSTVQTMVLSPDKMRLIVGGKFTMLNGKPAYGMGSVSIVNGSTLPWAANQTIRDAGANGAILSLRTDGQRIYGSGYAFGAGSNFEGTFAADPLTGNVVLLNDCHGDTYDVLPLGQVLYSVGHAHDCSWIGSFPDTNPRVRWQRAIAQTIAPKTTNKGPDNYGWNYNGRPASAVLQWYPSLDSGSFTGQTQAAWSLAGNSKYVVLGGEFPRVNGKAQQGLVRMAVSGSAPNKRGPTYTTKPARPIPATTAKTTATGSASIAFGTAWDQDNQTLTYELLRNGAVVKTGTFATNFWTVPNKTWTDSGLQRGVRYTYQTRIRDSFGNTLLSPVSNAITG